MWEEEDVRNESQQWNAYHGSDLIRWIRANKLPEMTSR